MLKMKMLCCAIYTCARAYSEKNQWSLNLDMAFISKAYHNWKDASTKFNIHSSSNCHKEATLKVMTLPSTTKISQQYTNKKNFRLMIINQVN